ncbi:hypothetical protein D3C74_251970 [compost metagenome]
MSKNTTTQAAPAVGDTVQAKGSKILRRVVAVDGTQITAERVDGKKASNSVTKDAPAFEVIDRATPAKPKKAPKAPKAQEAPQEAPAAPTDAAPVVAGFVLRAGLPDALVAKKGSVNDRPIVHTPECFHAKGMADAPEKWLAVSLADVEAAFPAYGTPSETLDFCRTSVVARHS